MIDIIDKLECHSLTLHCYQIYFMLVFIDIVIQSITNQIKVTRGMAESNYKNMDIWSQLYGDFNKQGLRAHPKIKLREKHPQYMMFNMNY